MKNSQRKDMSYISFLFLRIKKRFRATLYMVKHMILNIKEAFFNIKNRIKAIIIFEAFHKFFAIFFLFPIIQQIISLATNRYVGDYLDLNGMQTLLFQWQTYIYLIAILILFVFWTSVEYFFLSNVFFNPVISIRELLSIGGHRLVAAMHYHKRQVFESFLAYASLLALMFVGVARYRLSLFAMVFDFINLHTFIKVLVIILMIFLFIWALKEVLFLPYFNYLFEEHVKYDLKKMLIFYYKFVPYLIFLFISFVCISLLVHGTGSLIAYLVKDHLIYSEMLGIKYVLQWLRTDIIFLFVPFVSFGIISILIQDDHPLLKEIANREIKVTNYNATTSRVILIIVALIYGLHSLYYVLPYFDENAPKRNYNPTVIAHRGTSVWAPGNSHASISEAIRMDVDYVEMDIQVTKDGIPVLFHDRNLASSNTNADEFGYEGKRIKDLTYDELEQLTLTTYFPDQYQEKIITLKTALSMMNRRCGAMIEIKTTDYDDIQLIKETIEASHFTSHYYILSFDLNILKYFSDELQCDTNLLLSGYIGTLDSILEADYVSALSFEYAALNTKVIQSIHREDKKVYVWTLNDHDQIQKSLSSGVDGIITDLPSLVQMNLFDTTNGTFIDIFKFMTS